MSLFPPTRHSVLDALRGDDPGRRRAAQETLAQAYLRPIQRYLAIRWRRSPDEAYDGRRARLRTYLRLCIDAMVRNADAAWRREKRGGGQLPVALESVAEVLEAPGGDSPEALFEQEWRRSVLSLAVDRTRSTLLARGKEPHWAVLEGFDLDPPGGERPSYAELGERLGLSVTEVTNRLSFARRILRQQTLEVLRELTQDETEFRQEARTLLGVEP